MQGLGFKLGVVGRGSAIRVRWRSGMAAAVGVGDGKAGGGRHDAQVAGCCDGQRRSGRFRRGCRFGWGVDERLLIIAGRGFVGRGEGRARVAADAACRRPWCRWRGWAVRRLRMAAISFWRSACSEMRSSSSIWVRNSLEARRKSAISLPTGAQGPAASSGRRGAGREER